MIRDLDFIKRVLPEVLGIAETCTFGASCGLIGSGKTSFAKAVSDVCPSFVVDSFARPLKEEYAAQTGIALDNLYNTDLKEQYRDGMQQHSEKYLNQDRYHYIRLLLLSTTPGQRKWIDDLRTIEEAHVIWALGGTMIQVYTDPYVRAARGVKTSKRALQHFTETEMAVVSGETMRALGGERIYNNGSLDNLKDEAFKVLERKSLLTTPILIK